MVEVALAQRPSSEAYDAFAYAYDAALGAPFFSVLRPQLERLLAKYSIRGGKHLDVACGTGHAVDFFSARGFLSLGVDASLPMLRMARERATHLIAGDMRELPLTRNFNLVTSFYDSFNHLLKKQDLLSTFRSVRSVMHDGAFFWFDMNHPRAYVDVWAIEDPFVAEGEDYHLEIDTRYDRRSKLATGKVTGWRLMGGERVPISEIHLQRSYSERDITASLREAGLRVLETFRFNPFEDDETTLQMKMFFAVTTL